jgi:hypothetical protein
LASAPSGTGFQVSLGGIFGLLFAQNEGFEINVLGLVFGANPKNLAVTLPGVGRVPYRADWTGGMHAVADSSDNLNDALPISEASATE